MGELAGRSPAQIFWRFWTAETTSTMGSAVTAVALPLTAVTVLNASSFEMGVLSAAGYVAWLVIGLPSGAIAQRLPLRGTQVAMDAVRAMAVFSVPLAWWWGELTVTHLVLTALVVSFARVIYDTCAATLLPSIVEPARLQARNSLMAGTGYVADLAGPTLGGVLVQLLGAVSTLVVDVVSYVVSGLLLTTLPERRITTAEDRPAVRTMIREGWIYVVRHPVLAPCLWFATAINFVCGAQLALFPIYLVRDLGAPVALVGLLLAAEGAGSLAGAALTSRATRAVGTARALVIAGFAATAGALVLPLGTGGLAYFLFAAGNIVYAGAVAVFSVTNRTYQQTNSPIELLPRVVATVRFISFGAIPVGALVGGALGGLAGSRLALVLFGTATILAPLALLLSPVRHQRDLAEQPVEQRRRHDRGRAGRARRALRD